jgi:hypothetical protein
MLQYMSCYLERVETCLSDPCVTHAVHKLLLLPGKCLEAAGNVPGRFTGAVL